MMCPIIMTNHNVVRDVDNDNNLFFLNAIRLLNANLATSHSYLLGRQILSLNWDFSFFIFSAKLRTQEWPDLNKIRTNVVVENHLLLDNFFFNAF